MTKKVYLLPPKEKLQKLAELAASVIAQSFDHGIGSLNPVLLHAYITAALEQVQAACRNERFVWPDEKEFLELAGRTGKADEIHRRAYKILTDNIRLAPVDEVSDEEIDELARTIAGFVPTHTPTQNEIDAFKAGYRMALTRAEKKARDE